MPVSICCHEDCFGSSYVFLLSLLVTVVFEGWVIFIKQIIQHTYTLNLLIIFLILTVALNFLMLVKLACIIAKFSYRVQGF